MSFLMCASLLCRYSQRFFSWLQFGLVCDGKSTASESDKPLTHFIISVSQSYNLPFLFYDTLEVFDCEPSVQRRKEFKSFVFTLKVKALCLLYGYSWCRGIFRVSLGVFTLYLSVPCWSCFSSLSSTVNCRVMPSIRACSPRYSLYSALKSFLYL